MKCFLFSNKNTPQNKKPLYIVLKEYCRPTGTKKEKQPNFLLNKKCKLQPPLGMVCNLCLVCNIQFLRRKIAFRISTCGGSHFRGYSMARACCTCFSEQDQGRGACVGELRAAGGDGTDPIRTGTCTHICLGAALSQHTTQLQGLSRNAQGSPWTPW